MEGQLEEVVEEIPLNVQEPLADTRSAEMDGDCGTSREDELTPRMGMTFGSIEEAHYFYNKYASHVGFRTVIRSTEYKEDGQVKYIVLACSKQGKSRAKGGPRSSRSRTITKTNCKARIKMRHQNDGLFLLHLVVLEHNHPVNPSVSRFLRSTSSSGNHDKMPLEMNEGEMLPPTKLFRQIVGKKGNENVQCHGKDHRNYDEGLKFREGDVQVIQEYLARMHEEDSNFFHMMNLDDEGDLRNVFWADGRSRAAYQYYGDVISFDTKYLMNKYDVPFAPIFGVNHHGHLVMLGCCLLSSETTETYIWLFKVMLSCMLGHPPNAIITDQCPTIEEAVAKVFPGSRHRLCLRHIMKKVPEKLVGEEACREITDTLSKLVYNCLNYSDFEDGWRIMIEKYGLEKNRWLKSLYEDRHRWVPVFVKDTFWAGMSSTQHGGRMNNFFDDYVTSNSSIKQFIQQYESALRSKYEKEAQDDFLSFTASIQLISQLKMEEQLSKIYTINIFKMFQDELKQLIHVSPSLNWTEGTISLYMVKEYVKEKQMEFQVLYNAEDQEVRCICCAFDFRGILCRHAASVLINQGVTEVPSRYVLNRWRKDFVRLHALGSLNNVTPNCPTERYHNLYRHCLKQITDIAMIGAICNERYEFALKIVREAKEKLLAFDSSCGKMQLDKNTLSMQNGSENGVPIMSMAGKVLTDLPLSVSDPVSEHARWRRVTKRKQSQLELTMNKLKKRVSQSKQEVSNESEHIMQPSADVSNKTVRSEDHVSLQSKDQPLSKEIVSVAENVSPVSSSAHLVTHTEKQESINIMENSSPSDLSVSNTMVEYKPTIQMTVSYLRKQCINQYLGNIKKLLPRYQTESETT